MKMDVAIIRVGDWSACYVDGMAWFWDESSDFDWPDDGFGLLSRIANGGGNLSGVVMYEIDEMPDEWRPGAPTLLEDALATFTLEGEDGEDGKPVATVSRA